MNNFTGNVLHNNGSPDARKKGGAKPNPSARSRARRLALQALYQWHIAKSPLNQIEAQFRTDNDFSKVDDGYFTAIIHGVPSQASQLDEAMSAGTAHWLF